MTAMEICQNCHLSHCTFEFSLVHCIDHICGSMYIYIFIYYCYCIIIISSSGSGSGIGIIITKLTLEIVQASNGQAQVSTRPGMTLNVART